MHCSKQKASLGPFLGVVAALVAVTLTGCGQPTVASNPPDGERVTALREMLGSSVEASGEDGDAEASGQQPTGWATLKGRFRMGGTPPRRLEVQVNKDKSVCQPPGRSVLSEEVMVGSQGGIQNVVVFLSQKISADEPWTHPDAAPGKTDEVVFDQKECVFLSHVLPMQTTQRLKILNSDPVGHNTKLSPNKNAGFDRTVAADSNAFYQPAAEENAPFPVGCAIHPWMNAWILIRDNSYFAVTDEEGAFEIPNLPAGVELEFRVWQEKANFLQDVTVGGKKSSWKKGRVLMTLDPSDLSRNELDVVVDASVFN